MKDYYGILGVSSTATQLEIKRAYRRLAVLYHPDKNPDPGAESLFKEINEAYDVLGDPEERARYDQRLGNPFEDIVQTEQRARHRDPRYRPKPPGYKPRQDTELRDLMVRSRPLLKWVTYVAVFITVLFGADYFIPYKTSEETVTNSFFVPSRRPNHQIIITGTGREIKSYDLTPPVAFVRDPIIIVHVSRIYGNVMQVTNRSGNVTIHLGYAYKHFGFFPLALFLAAVVGIVFRQYEDLAFNAGVVSILLLIVTLFVIL